VSTETEVIEFNDSLYSTYVGQPHDIPSHRYTKTHSWNKPSILVDCLVILLIGLLGSFVVELGIFHTSPRVEVLSAPLIPALTDTFDLPLDTAKVDPSKVDVPSTVERSSLSLQRKAVVTPHATVVPSKVERVISFAMSQRGKPYVWGAAGPRSFDCSGLVVASFRSIGITVPHYTGTLLRRGIKVSRNGLRRGDLIFPTSSHVGIYLGGNKMIVASSGHGRIMVQTVYSFYTARRLL